MSSRKSFTRKNEYAAEFNILNILTKIFLTGKNCVSHLSGFKVFKHSSGLVLCILDKGYYFYIYY